MESSPPFFIPDRLRGIPLVSDTPGWRNVEEPTTTTSRSTSTSTTISSSSKTGVYPSSTTSLPVLPTLKSIQLDKRHVVMEASQTTGLNGLLFRPYAMTASTSNIVSKNTTSTSTTTSTTKRPAKTTTRRPTTTTSTRRLKTTTRQPISQRTSNKPIQVVSRKDLAPLIASSTAAMRETRLEMPTRTTSGNSATSSAPTVTKTPVQSITTAAVTSPSTTSKPTTTASTVPSTSATRSTSAQLNLTRATQPLTTQPGYQRRTQQSVGSQRYINRPNGYAGENWVLFNQPGGQLSFFELMTLASSVLMVSTIIAVIVFNWFRSSRKKSASTRNKQIVVSLDKSPSPSQIPGPSADQLSTISGRPFSMSPAGSSTNAPESAVSQVGGKASLLSQIKTKADKLDQSVEGLQSTISSEFKGAMNVANKAMAIVQPTENNDAISSANSELDKSKDGQRPVNRSVSDLSSSQRKTEPPPAAKREADRVSALEEVFYGSTSNPKPAATKPDEKKASAKASVAPDARLSASSLESIELPEPLVESIKRSEARNPTTVGAPSPNPLLAGAGKISSNPQAVAPVTAPPVPVTDVAPAPTTAPAAASKAPAAAPALAQAPSSDNGALEKSGKEPRQTDGTAVATKSGAPAMKQDSQERGKAFASGATNNKISEGERPPNPISKLIEDEKAGAVKKAPAESTVDSKPQSTKLKDEAAVPQVKNHQVVVNKLDKRKTNLEIVDIRDESVTGKMRNGNNSLDEKLTANESSGWISMDGVAVVQPARPINTPMAAPQSPTGNTAPLVSPSEIIEGRFNVDYNDKKKLESGQFDSVDSKQESLNNIDDELEADNKLKNRKYFVYIVQDGHFTAKKECIARIELPQKRRITLAEVRDLIANSRDISLSSLRRNKFKFVTETYRLLNENEDAAVLHQVYPTQGVFLKLNIPDQETQAYQLKGRSRLSSGSGNPRSTVSHTTIASRRRATSRGPQDPLPAIEVNYAQGEAAESAVMSYGRTRASSVGRRQPAPAAKKATASTNYRRSKSNVQTGRQPLKTKADSAKLPPIAGPRPAPALKRSPTATKIRAPGPKVAKRTVQQQQLQAIGSAATDLGSNVISGVKQLFSSTFHL